MSEKIGKSTILDSSGTKVHTDIIQFSTVIVNKKIIDVIKYQEEENPQKKGYCIKVSNENELLKELNLNSTEIVALYTALGIYFKEVMKLSLSDAQKKVSPKESFKFNTSEHYIKSKK